jgi:hypothetical protein
MGVILFNAGLAHRAFGQEFRVIAEASAREIGKRQRPANARGGPAADSKNGRRPRNEVGARGDAVREVRVLPRVGIVAVPDGILDTDVDHHRRKGAHRHDDHVDEILRNQTAHVGAPLWLSPWLFTGRRGGALTIVKVGRGISSRTAKEVLGVSAKSA